MPGTFGPLGSADSAVLIATGQFSSPGPYPTPSFTGFGVWETVTEEKGNEFCTQTELSSDSVYQVLALQSIDLDQTSMHYFLEEDNSHRWLQRLNKKIYMTLGIMISCGLIVIISLAVNLKLTLLAFLKTY